jgi:putative ABC transport system permease protein
MLLSDSLGLPLAALWQQKTRTFLTILGVIFGSFVLAASLSIGQGVQDTIRRESGKREALRRIAIYPNWEKPGKEVEPESIQVDGQMTVAKRVRLRKAMAEYKARLESNRPRVVLSPSMLESLARLDHVEAVIPFVRHYGYVILEGQSQPADLASARADDEDLRKRVEVGRMFDSSAEPGMLVSEFLLYRLGIVDDRSVKEVLGKTMRLEFRQSFPESGIGVYLVKPNGGEVTREETAALDRLRQQLPKSIEKLDLEPAEAELLRNALSHRSEPLDNVTSVEFTVIGVLRLPSDEEQAKPWDPMRTDSELVLSTQTATELFFSMPRQSERGVDHAALIVDHEDNVEEVFQEVAGMGLRAHAVLEFVKQQRLMYLMIFGGMTCVAAVALLVAAVGIANTMLMSVLERTREIGIMKAVGASSGQLQFIFLLEGAIIGLVGGVVGLLSAWAASFPGDAWLRSMVSRDLKIELKETIFVFPPWVILVVISFAVVVTTLAAVYPARRAARIDPVAALRHE